MVRRKYPKAQEELVRKSFEQDPIIKRFPAAKITEVWQEIPDEVQDPPAEFQQQAFPVADSPKRPFEQPPPPTSPPGELAPPSDADYQMFEAIGVNRELVDLAGIHRIEDHQARDLGIYLPREASSGSLDGWAVPYYIYVDGERKRVGWVGRRDQGKPKYLCSKDKRHCYIPPTVTEADLADTSQPIIFVESEKSALMLAALFERFRDRISRRAIPMAVRGCTGWHMKVTEIQPDGTKQKKSGGVLDEITRYVTPGRVCLVLFDANWRKNSDVSREQAAFKRYLRSRSVKANAKVCYLPAGDWNGPDDYLAKCGDEAMFKILDGKREDTTPEDVHRSAQFSDCVNADRIVADHGDKLRFCYELSSWLYWDGHRWKPDSQQRARQLTEKTLRKVLAQMAANGTAEDIARAAKLLASSAVSNALREAEKKLLVNIEQLDSDPMLITFANGTLDLRTGELSEHDPEDYITKMIHHNYNPDAECPKLWIRLLHHAVGDEGVRYLQKAFGYLLTGDTCEKKFFLLYGERDTGKTTALDVLAILLKEFHSQLMVDTLMEKRGNDSAMHEDLATLRGCRFATTSELDRGRRLSIATLKRICQGMGSISVSAKWQKKMTFPETHTLFIDSNHLPLIPADEAAVWSRLVIVAFGNPVPPSEQDRTLKDKIVAEEAEGILAWLVAGELLRQEKGLEDSPTTFAAAKTKWQREMDSLGQFIEEYCIVHPDEKAPRTALYKLYAEAVGHSAIPAQEFTKQLELRGITRSNDRRYYYGIAVKDTTQSPAQNSTTSSEPVSDDDPNEPPGFFDGLENG